MSSVAEQAAPRPRIATPEPFVLGGLVVLLAALWWAYRDSLSWMRWGWDENPYYSHGYLVPVISGWLFWRVREALITTEWRTFWPGLALVGAAAAAYVVGRFLDINMAVAFSFVVMLHGILLTVGGPKVYRLGFFPLFFLFFGVPISWLWLYDLSFPMQQLSAKLATVMLYIVTGAKTAAEGSVMLLDGEEYVVGVACSGFKAILGLTMVGVLVAYLTETTPARKAVLLAVSVPIAVASNVCRLFMILCVGRIWGHAFAVGIFHDKISGPVMLVIAIGVLIGVARLVVGQGAEIAAAPPPSGDGTPRLRLAWQPLGLVAVGLLATSAIGRVAAPPPTDVPDVDLSSIAMSFGDWRAEQEEEIGEEVFEELGNVEIISRVYENKPLKAQAYMHVICGRGRRSLHPPSACIRGAGNQILDEKEVELEVAGEKLPFEQVTVGLDGFPIRVAMWTYTDGEVTITDYTKFAGTSVTDRNRIWTQVHIGVGWAGSVEATTDYAHDFLRAAWPEIKANLQVLVPKS